MRALVKTQKGKGFIELRNVPEPECGSDQVKIKIAACGVCGTDIHVWHDNFPYWPPVVLGHEFTGTVIEIGSACSRFKIGDRVVAEPHTKSCGHCYLCRTGNIQICSEKRSPGWGIDGGMAEYICYPEMLLHKLPENISSKAGAVIEPTANAVHDVLERAHLQAGDFVVVVGPGPIGLLSAMTARAAGAREVMLIGTDSDEQIRLPKARDLGFKYVINCQQENPVKRLANLTNHLGADLVVECSGSPAGIASTVDLVRKKGCICAIGLPGNQPITFPYSQAAFKVCDVAFCLSTSYTSWDKAIDLAAAGKIQIEDIVTHYKPLEQWESVFEDINKQRAIKAVLVP